MKGQKTSRQRNRGGKIKPNRRQKGYTSFSEIVKIDCPFLPNRVFVCVQMLERWKSLWGSESVVGGGCFWLKAPRKIENKARGKKNKNTHKEKERGAIV